MCKEIAPIDGSWGEYGGKRYNRQFPRTVKSNVSLPEGWEVTLAFEHLEPFCESRISSETGAVEKVPVIEITCDIERVAVHTCRRALSWPGKGSRLAGHDFYATWVRRGGPWDRTDEFFPDRK